MRTPMMVMRSEKLLPSPANGVERQRQLHLQPAPQQRRVTRGGVPAPQRLRLPVRPGGCYRRARICTCFQSSQWLQSGFFDIADGLHETFRRYSFSRRRTRPHSALQQVERIGRIIFPAAAGARRRSLSKTSAMGRPVFLIDAFERTPGAGDAQENFFRRRIFIFRRGKKCPVYGQRLLLAHSLRQIIFKPFAGSRAASPFSTAHAFSSARRQPARSPGTGVVAVISTRLPNCRVARG